MKHYANPRPLTDEQRAHIAAKEQRKRNRRSQVAQRRRIRAPRSSRRVQPNRGRVRTLVALIIVVAVVVGFVISGQNSGNLPKGSFGKLIGCLQSHPSLSVQTPSGGPIGPNTTGIEVWGNFQGGMLAGMNSLGGSHVVSVGTDGMTAGEYQAIEACLAQ